MTWSKRPELTEAQAAILSTLCAAARPLTAYEVLGALRACRPTAGPPTAYRALSRLESLGLVHRLESLNAYVACGLTHHGASPAFAICEGCGEVRELASPHVADGLAALAEHGGFAVTKAVVEMHGRCADCRRAEV